MYQYFKDNGHPAKSSNTEFVQVLEVLESA